MGMGMRWDGGALGAEGREGGPSLAGGIQCQQPEREVYEDKKFNTVHSVNEWMELISQGTAASWHSTKMQVILPQPICDAEEAKDVVDSCLSRLLWPPQYCWQHYPFAWKSWKCRWQILWCLAEPIQMGASRRFLLWVIWKAWWVTLQPRSILRIGNCWNQILLICPKV